jgi:acyl-CoA thioester hydrolase
MNASLSPVIVRVQTYELDSFGHVNNSVYLNYLEAARSEFLEQLGVSFHDFAALNVQLVIVEAYVRYQSPARFGDEIAILGRFHDLRRTSLTIDYALTEHLSGRRIATAQTKGAFIDPATGKPVRAPQRFRDAFASVAAPRSPARGN